MHKTMDENFLNMLYIKHNDKIGVLSANNHEVVSHILGTDLTLVVRPQEGKTYLLVPLTKNHTFKFNGDSIEVDGKTIKSDMYWREDACQWIEINDTILKEVA